MHRLAVTTYNTYRERKGRDEALDALLGEDALVCLQELSISRALELRRRFGGRVFLSRVMCGWEFLAVVLPADASFVARRAVPLNSYFGVVPTGWSLRRARMLYADRRRGWRDGLTLRAAQVCHVSWRGREFRVVHTHLPFERGLRDRCLGMLPGLSGSGNTILCGDLNATASDVHLADLMFEMGLRAAGPETPTHASRRRIDYVAYRGGFQEAGYRLTEGRSDHRVVGVELEVA